MHITDVAQIDNGSIGPLDRQIVEGRDLLRRVIDQDIIFEFADLLRANRQDQILSRDRLDDVLWLEPQSLQLVLIEIDPDLAHLAPIGIGYRRASNRGQLRPKKILRRVVEFDFGARLAGEGKLDHRHGRGVIHHDLRRVYAGRQVFQNGLRGRRHLRHGKVDLYLGLEINPRDAIAKKVLRLNMFDIVDERGQRQLVGIDDATRHIVRREADISPDHADDRNADGGKDIGRSFQRRDGSQNQDHHAEDHEGVWALERNQNQREHIAKFSPAGLDAGHRKAAP